MNLGREIEDIVENLCKKSFFADFTVKSPKYRKPCGQEKEAADLLVIFNNTLLAIQIKSKTLSSSSAGCGIEKERVKKWIEKSMNQFRALAEAVENPDFKTFLNGRGMQIEFDIKRITNVILIVIFVPVWVDGKRDSAEVRFGNTCCTDDAIPIHVFTLKQFSLLLLILDTLPDFLLYLDTRLFLHHQKIIPSGCDPIDELALITFERKNLIDMVQNGTLKDITGLHRRHFGSVERLERKEKPSYFVDRLIEQLYLAIGIKLPVDRRFNLLVEPNSKDAYRSIIPYLAKLNRKDRSLLVEFLLNRVQKCRNQEIAFRGMKFSEKSEESYLVLAARFARPERRIALSNIAMGMGYKFQVKTVIGLAVGHEWPGSSEFDVAVVDVSKLKPSSGLIEMTEVSFSKSLKSILRDS